MKTNSLDFDAQVLREKILDLAMRGKLVKQDPNDEPASVLLEKIKAEKAELVKDKKIKKSKPLPEITDDEKPFDIPESWEWVRLGEYAEKVTDQVASGSFAAIKENVRKYKHEEFALMIKTADFANNFSKNLTYTDEHGYKFLSNSNLFGGELILSNIGSIGKCFIVPNLKKPMTLAPNSIMVKVPEETLKKFLYYFIQSPVGNSELWKITSGTTMKKFNKTGLKTILVPVPPLKEQSRIAAKIAQLFALLRKVETSTQQYAELQTLLKSKVLDLAMRGKLVEQDPNDEPASVLLEKIKAEKDQLIKEKKIKKSKPLSPITDEEKPFKIPDSWEWVRLGDVLTILRGGSPRPIKKYLTDDPNGINWIKIGDSTTNSRYIDHAAEKIIPEGLHKTRVVHKGDFLLSNSMSFGRPYILKIDGAVHDGWLILSDYDKLLDKNYLYYLLSSNYINLQFKSLATGSTVKNLNRDRVANTIALVPPLQEQKRIAAKIAQLFTLLHKVASSN